MTQINEDGLEDGEAVSERTTSFDTFSSKDTDKLPSLHLEIDDISQMLFNGAPSQFISHPDTSNLSSKQTPTELMPSTQVKQTFLPTAPFKIEVANVQEPWQADSQFYAFEMRIEELDNRVRGEEIRYAKFMARRDYLSQMVSKTDFEQIVNSVSLRLVYYDPNFDFRTSGQQRNKGLIESDELESDQESFHFPLSTRAGRNF